MRKLLNILALTGAVLSGTVPAVSHANTITFDQGLDTSFALFPPLLTHEDALVQGDYFVGLVSTKANAAVGDFVGSLVDGADVANTCVNVVCPTNNSTTFLALLDDGLPYVGRLDGGDFRIKTFDASFIAAGGVTVPSISMLLRVYGFAADGGVYFEDVLLPGPDNGAYSFSTYTLSDEFSNRSYAEVDFYGYSCNAAGSCSRTGNTAQFAIDNIGLLPEPESLALVGLAFAGMTALRRRRQGAV